MRSMMAIAFALLVAFSGRASEVPPSEMSAQLIRSPQTVGAIVVAKELWSVGVESGPPEQEFGSIIDAAIGPDQTVYLLDAAEHLVRVFDGNGRFVRTIGRRGRGPGELAEPRAIAHDGDSLLYVLDGVNGLVVFRARGAQATFVRNIISGTPAVSHFCLLGNRIALYALGAGDLVHLLTQTGQRVRTFGGQFGSPNDAPGARAVLGSGGRIACDQGRDAVVIVSGYLPELRAYRASDGALLWADSLRSFNTAIHERVGTFIRRTIPRGGMDVNIVLRSIGPGVVLAQASRTRSGEDLIFTRLLDVGSGRQLFHGDKVKALPSSRGTRGVVIRQRPHSVATVVELSFTTGASGPRVD